MLREAGYIPMSGQIVDASLVAAPRQRNTNAEKADIKAGRIPEHWRDKPAKLSHKDRDARWTLKFTKAKPQADGTIPAMDLAIPAFGYKNHISIDRRFRLIRCWKTTDASAHDGARLREGLLDRSNTGSNVWADTAYRSAANEHFMERHGFVSKVHHKKPPHRDMPIRTRRSNAGKIRHPLPGRACLRRSEIVHGIVRAHRWHPKGRYEDRPRQPRLQYPAPPLPRAHHNRLNPPMKDTSPLRTAENPEISQSGQLPLRMIIPK